MTHKIKTRFFFFFFVIIFCVKIQKSYLWVSKLDRKKKPWHKHKVLPK